MRKCPSKGEVKMKRFALLLAALMLALSVVGCGKAEQPADASANGNTAAVFMEENGGAVDAPNAEGCVNDGLTY